MLHIQLTGAHLQRKGIRLAFLDFYGSQNLAPSIQLQAIFLIRSVCVCGKCPEHRSQRVVPLVDEIKASLQRGKRERNASTKFLFATNKTYKFVLCVPKYLSEKHKYIPV